MAQFEFMIERKLFFKPNTYHTSNVTNHLGTEFETVEEALNYVATKNYLWKDEYLWAYKFGNKVVLLNMEHNKSEKVDILKTKGWC